MNGEAPEVALNAEGLRERNTPLRATIHESARKVVLELNAQEDRTQKDEQRRKTYGRTPDGIGQLPLELLAIVLLPSILCSYIFHALVGHTAEK